MRPDSVSKSTILMILQSDFPPDIRVEKEMKALLSTGRYNLSILCNNIKGFKKLEIHNHVRVIRLPYIQFLGKLVNRILNYPLWFNPMWLIKGILVQKTVRPDIIHVHDLPLMFLGLILARLRKARLIYDMHENYPATFDLWKKGGLLRPILRNKRLAIWYDRYSLMKADGIITIEPEHIKWIKENYYIKKEINVVSNTVDYEYYQRLPVHESTRKEFTNKWILTYLGMISTERNVDLAIEAVSELKKEIPNILFLIIGDGPDTYRLKKLTGKLGLENEVKFTGWVPFEETKTYIQISDVCLITRATNDWSNTTTPHKLYQYMALGKPVVASDASAIKRIIEETGCGEIFDSMNVQSLTKTILKVKNNLKDYGSMGKIATHNKYNWENSSKVLINLYDKLFINDKG